MGEGRKAADIIDTAWLQYLKAELSASRRFEFLAQVVDIFCVLQVLLSGDGPLARVGLSQRQEY